ncbi:hypothetical protein JTE90_002012 [Oedothorax gibbosus]|uniref:RNA-directed DNA polymerase n=1 Tax=Oedothorax gibbosus TaxID=931172 RepID=A0AAV6TP36_9ARAC|nr:hypothetical protein JTE90_002012 [Oedothorax gibbosus]
MKAVQQYIQEGWPKDRQSVSVLAKPYWNLQSELHIEDGLICRGQRLVIPRACRKEILQRIHVGHRGIVTCKNLARQSLYWPGLGSEVEMMVTNCQICQLHQKQNIKEPLLDRPIPDRPWQRVAIKVLNNSTQPARQMVDDLFPTISSSPSAAIPPSAGVPPAAQLSAAPTSRSGRAIKPPQRFLCEL